MFILFYCLSSSKSVGLSVMVFSDLVVVGSLVILITV